MKRLDGEWLVFLLPHNPDARTAAERLIEAIQRFNERVGSLPTELGLSTRLNEQPRQAMTEAARRLGLEVHEVPHIRSQDFWLGPVRKPEQS